MGEGLDRGLSFDISSAACSVDRIGLFGGEFARDEVLLDFLESFGFGEFGLGEGLIELLHDECRAGIVYRPKGGKDRFGSTPEEVAADARDFGAVLSCATDSGFAGAEDDEMDGAEAV